MVPALVAMSVEVVEARPSSVAASKTARHPPLQALPAALLAKRPLTT